MVHMERLILDCQCQRWRYVSVVDFLRIHERDVNILFQIVELTNQWVVLVLLRMRMRMVRRWLVLMLMLMLIAIKWNVLGGVSSFHYDIAWDAIQCIHFLIVVGHCGLWVDFHFNVDNGRIFILCILHVHAPCTTYSRSVDVHLAHGHALQPDESGFVLLEVLLFKGQ